ncbi:MAG: hotdog fold thioesterase [Desulfopila sp.]|nr:hotdog fold thioesterase [Desulfopila sp.]
MKKIWRKEASLEKLNLLSNNTMVKYLGIEFTELGEDFLVATMTVDSRTHQPFGLLHGGASVALAESVASMAGNLAVDDSRYCVGLEINANHVRPIRSGQVTATARPLALGRTTQVWDIKIVNDSGKLICVSRLTLAVRETGESSL